MGPGGCGWRMKKGFLQTGFCLVGLLCLSSGLFLYHQLQEKVLSSESLSLKFKQQQEALSAQLQVVYEHRSRLERSLQKERGEHKKTKEDFLVYKLEAQETLNKEKQDAMNRYGAISSQHKIMKNQHEDVKKQLMDLQAQQNTLKLQHRKVEEVQSQKYSKLQQEKEDQGLSLQDTISKLREENKLLRKAHQEVRTQLVSAQVQVEEFRRLKVALQKMPSFKELGAARGHQQVQLLVPEKKLFRALGAAVPQPDVEEDVGPDAIPPVKPTELAVKNARGGGNEPPPQVLVQPMIQAPAMPGPRPEHFVPHRHPSLPPWLVNDFYALRFMRTVNSVPAADKDQKLATGIPDVETEARIAPVAAAPQEKPALQAGQAAIPANVQLQSWQDVVKNLNTKNGEAVVQMPPGTMRPRGVHLQLANPQPGMMILRANPDNENKEGADDEELEMDAGMIDREDDDTGAMRDHIAQEPMMPEDVADPAHDPNNQGEDEFEEAALERPAFAGKRTKADLNKQPEVPAGAEPPKKANETEIQDKAGEEADDYQEDQEPDTEDHGGEVDDTEDLEMGQKDKSPDDDAGENDKKDGYY